MPGSKNQRNEKVSITTWNIRGVSDKVLGDKSRNDCFVESIAKNDIIVLTETWTRNDVQIAGYKNFVSTQNTDSNNRSGRLSGGVCLLFKEKFSSRVILMKTSVNFIWCKVDKSCLETELDIYICGAYIPPHNSPYFTVDLFEELENDISLFSSRGSILFLGDLNAGTGKYVDNLDKTMGNILKWIE